MKKKILSGSLIAVALLVLMSFSPSITADVNELDIDNQAKGETSPTPLVLAFQLINKLRNHPDIQNVETEEDVLLIIESDEELNSIYEQLSGKDCGCEDDIPTWERLWPFPFICNVIGIPLFMFAWLAWMTQGITWIGEMAGIFGFIFNCHWY